MPSLHPAEICKPTWREHLVRFLFGGFVTVGTGLIAKRYGPAVGGLFLAFPAILPASLTLVREHAGRRATADAAAGSRAGALGLIGFGAVATTLAPRGAVLTLVVATVTWAALSFVIWAVMYGRSVQSRKRVRARLTHGRANAARKRAH